MNHDRCPHRNDCERDADCDHLRALLAEVEAWTHEMGASLVPHGADTYGEGMRDAKAQVAARLSAARKVMP